MDMSCRERLQEEYERILLEETDGPELLERPSEEAIRQRFLQLFTALRGELPDQQLVDEFVEFTHHREHGHQSTLDAICAQLDSFVPLVVENERKLEPAAPIRDPVCIAAFEFPTGPFNAHIRRVPGGGFLVLVTSGVLTLLRHVTKIMGHSTTISDAGFQYLDHVRIGPFGRSPMEAMEDAISVYLDRARPGAGAIPDLSGDQRARMDDLFRACVTFLVAHEYAHALAGHLSNPAFVADRHNYNRLEEVEADWLGAKLLLAVWRWGPFEDDKAQIKLQTLLAGPLFFFALESVIAEAEQRFGRRPSLEDTELGMAPPAVRKVMIKELYAEIFGPGPFPLTDLYEDWVYRMASAR